MSNLVGYIIQSRHIGDYCANNEVHYWNGSHLTEHISEAKIFDNKIEAMAVDEKILIWNDNKVIEIFGCDLGSGGCVVKPKLCKDISERTIESITILYNDTWCIDVGKNGVTEIKERVVTLSPNHCEIVYDVTQGNKISTFGSRHVLFVTRKKQ